MVEVTKSTPTQTFDTISCAARYPPPTQINYNHIYQHSTSVQLLETVVAEVPAINCINQNSSAPNILNVESKPNE